MSVIAAAVIGSAVVGYAGSKNASKSQNKAIDAQSASADQAAQLGRDELDFSKQVYNDGKPLRDQAAQTALEVSQAQLASQKTQDALAADYAAYNKETFRPLEQGLVRDAQGYDTTARRGQAVAESTADVERGFGQAQAGLTRSLGRSGISIGGNRSIGLQQDAALAKAKAIAGGASTAVKGVETTGFARRADAANLGRGLASSQATSAGLALAAGNGASNNGINAINAQSAGAGMVQNGYGGAQSATLSAGSLYGQVGNAYGQQANGYGAALGGLGQIAGQYAGSAAGSTQLASLFAGSDVNIKKNTGMPADTEEALEQVEATPVEEGWSYDTAKGGPDDGGVPHTGPMAQSVNRTMGEEMAPGGKAIDLVGMNGKLMAAVQQLGKTTKQMNQRVARLEERMVAA